MRPIGLLTCDDCGGEHKVHVNRSGHLVSMISCPASDKGMLGPLARNELRKLLFEARRELELAEQMFISDRLHYRDLATQIDDVYRRLVNVQNTIDAHSPKR